MKDEKGHVSVGRPGRRKAIDWLADYLEIERERLRKGLGKAAIVSGLVGFGTYALAAEKLCSMTAGVASGAYLECARTVDKAQALGLAWSWLDGPLMIALFVAGLACGFWPGEKRGRASKVMTLGVQGVVPVVLSIVVTMVAPGRAGALAVALFELGKVWMALFAGGAAGFLFLMAARMTAKRQAGG